MHLEILEEIEKIENKSYNDIIYLNEIKDTTSKERKIIELFNQVEEVKEIHKILNNRTVKESNKVIKTLISQKCGIIEMAQHMKKFIKEIA